jgi:hypothetical protein
VGKQKERTGEGEGKHVTMYQFLPLEIALREVFAISE